MNRAVEYMEEHLDGDIDMGQLSGIAHCSPYHFQRVFAYMSDMTLAEYIRRRRLTRAAFDLQNGGAKVIDVALKYGYDSPTSFSRAFQALHGVAPSAAKSEGARLVAYPPLSFQIQIKGASAMNYKIEQKGPFRLVGEMRTFRMENGENWVKIPQFWREVQTSGLPGKLVPLIDHEPFGVLGASIGDGTQNEFEYMIGVSTTQPAPAGLAVHEVPAYTWAIFECKGALPESIQEMSRRIMSEWLPTSGYEYAEGPDIEVYGDGDQSSPDYLCWVWMPVVKKA